MTDARTLQKQTLLEQLADVLQDQAPDNDESLELREIVARMVQELSLIHISEPTRPY